MVHYYYYYYYHIIIILKWFAAQRCCATKPVFEKIAKIQRSYVPSCGHTTFIRLTPAHNMTIIDKNQDILQ